MPGLNAIGIVAADTARSIAFYRLLGVDFPEDGEGHIEATLPSGIRFMLDSEEVVTSFRPDWTRETGNQLALAFQCASPAEVDELYARVEGRGLPGGEGALGRVLGPALRAAARPRRRAGRSLRAALASRLDVADPRRVRGCCRARRLRELGEDVRDVPMDGVLAEHERPRDLSVREAGRDEPQHLRLAAGQR